MTVKNQFPFTPRSVCSLSLVYKIKKAGCIAAGFICAKPLTAYLFRVVNKLYGFDVGADKL